MSDLEYSSEAKSITLGHYRHYKGGDYDVLFVGRSSETDDLEEVVVYQDRNNKDLVWVQSVSRFLSESSEGPRFIKVDE